MSLLKDTKAETTPPNPILKKVTLKSIPGKINKSPKWNAPSVPSSISPRTPSRRREGATKIENKIWEPGGSEISQVNSNLRLLTSTVDISELNNAKDSDKDTTS